LKKALGLAQQMTEAGAKPPSPDDGIRLAELVLAMDRWLAAGGRRPVRWNGTTRSQPEE